MASDPAGGRKRAYGLAIQALEAADAAGIESVKSKLFQLLGDIYFNANKLDIALKAYSDAVASDGGLGDPEVHLRLGKAQFELGDEGRAADELCRAYMGGGREIFSDQPQKYFEFLKTKIQPGPDGW